MSQKTVLVVGANCPLGLNIIKANLNEGNKVIATSRNIKNNINKKNLNWLHFDPLENNSLDKLLIDLEKFNIFSVNYLSAIRDSEASNPEEVFGICLLNYLAIKENLSLKMSINEGGRFLSFSSSGTKYGGGKGKQFYALSKQCLEVFTSYDKALAKDNVLVNTIRVGVLSSVKDVNPNRIKLIPTNSPVNIDEISKMSILLNSVNNKSITCSVIPITGGE